MLPLKNTKKIILIVEDENLVVKALEFKLRRDGYDVIHAKDGREGIRVIENEEFDLMITDIFLPFNNGLELIIKAKQVNVTPDYLEGAKEIVKYVMDNTTNDKVWNDFEPIAKKLNLI